MQNKQQEYYKQRERLKFVSQNNVTKKVLDPDIMIEQLISDKETFKFNVKSETPYMLPKWLKLENNLVPKVYEQVWQAVKLNPGNQYCDTKIITQLFTTSGLSFDKLGYLWSITNVASPGFLTQQELYVMLALIALVQTGYHVKDITILKGINHPILPQLDYGFLNITVANPAINRCVIKNPLSDVRIANNLQQNSLNDIRTANNFQSQNVEPKTTYDFSNFPKPQKLAFPELKPKEIPKINLIPEIQPIAPPKFDVSKNSTDTNFPKFKEFKGYDFLNLNDLSIEPRSLDLPKFEAENKTFDDDEFTEFQSATVVTTNDEYTDFQSASPIVKYELDNFASEPIGDEKTNDLEPDLSTRNMIDADKYDVFRTLMDHPKKKEEEEEEDNGEDEDENDDDKFSEFFTADIKIDKRDKELTIKEKCLDACLRLLQEGLRIFSSISSERVLSEVLSDERGYRYFNQLKIVYETSQRFQRQYQNQYTNDAIQMAWEKLNAFIKYIPSDELIDEAPAEDDIDASLCKLCETKCDVNCVRYAGNNYHVTCINLFLHFVEDSKISAMLNI